MKIRLFPLAAAAAFLIVATPGPEVRAAAAKLPMLQAGSSDIVEVRNRRHHRARRHFHRPRHVYRHRHRHRIIRRHRGPRFGIYRSPRVVIYGGYGRCAWLRRRAIVTGSRYWWRRYRWCRGW